MLPNWCNAPKLVQGCLLRLGWMLVGAVMEQHFPRRGLLAGGIALVSAALHWIAGSAMPSYLVHCCRIWCSAARPGPVGCRRWRL